MKPTQPKLFRNSLYNLVGQAIPLVVGFISIPFLIRSLGLDRFGLLSLVWVFLGYLTFFDLGLSRAIIKIIAEDLAKKNDKEIPVTVWTTFWIVLILSSIGSVGLGLVSPWLITKTFQIPASLHDEAIWSLWFVALSIPIVTLIAVFRGVLEAQQRFFVVNILHSVSGIVTYVLPLLVSFFTKDVHTLIAAIGLARLATLLGHMIACQRQIPTLLIPLLPQKNSMQRLLRFGSWLTLSNLISPLMVYFDRFILGTFIPVGNLAYYTTPYEIVTRVLILPSAISRVMFPAFTSILSQEDKSEIGIIQQSLRTIGLILFPICAILILIARPGLNIWLGQEFADKSALILQIFAIGIFFNGLANIPYTLLQSANRPDLTAKVHVIELPFYAIALYAFTMKWGVQGAATAWSLRLIADYFLLSHFAQKLVPITIEARRHLAALAALLFVTFFMAQFQFAWREVLLAVGALVFIYWVFFLNLEERLVLLLKQPRPAGQDEETDKAAAIVVTFKPTPEDLNNLYVHKNQFESICVIDNGSPKGLQNELKEVCEKQNIKLILNSENLGIAHALNQGFEWAIQQKFKWACCFDQDSTPPANYLSRLFLAYNTSKQKDKIAIIGPQLLEKKTNRAIPTSTVPNGGDLVPVQTLITSGSLVRISAYKEIGGFDSKLFIDYVDHDFSFKARVHGYLVMECPSVVLGHSLGYSQRHQILFRQFFSTHHSAVRRYYNTRNRFYFYQKYLPFEPEFIFEDFYHFIKEVVKILLVEENKMQKLREVFHGLWHWLRGRFGKRESRP